MRGYPHFSFWIPITLAKNYLFPTVITFAKIHLYWEAPSLIDVSWQMHIASDEIDLKPSSRLCSRGHDFISVSNAFLVINYLEKKIGPHACFW